MRMRMRMRALACVLALQWARGAELSVSIGECTANDDTVSIAWRLPTLATTGQIVNTQSDWCLTVEGTRAPNALSIRVQHG